MSYRISPVDPATAQGSVGDILGAIKAKLGMIPNALKTMAHGPAALQGYVGLSGALSKGVLPVKVREQIALAVSQANECEYCLSAHSVTGKLAGLTPDQIHAARQGTAEDPKTQALLTLVHDIQERHGDITDEQFAAAREAGISDAELAEVVGNVALMTLTNYFNRLARPNIDFPRVLAAV